MLKCVTITCVNKDSQQSTFNGTEINFGITCILDRILLNEKLRQDAYLHGQQSVPFQLCVESIILIPTMLLSLVTAFPATSERKVKT